MHSVCHAHNDWPCAGVQPEEPFTFMAMHKQGGGQLDCCFSFEVSVKHIELARPCLYKFYQCLYSFTKTIEQHEQQTRCAQRGLWMPLRRDCSCVTMFINSCSCTGSFSFLHALLLVYIIKPLLQACSKCRDCLKVFLPKF